MRYLRRIPADIVTGFRAGLDLLLWGHAYPRLNPDLAARLVTSHPTAPAAPAPEET
jgi:hypothetical protein